MSYLMEKPRKKAKASRKKMKVLVGMPVLPDTRQSLLGKLSLLFGLAAFFLLNMQFLIRLQAFTFEGAWVIEARWLRWISMGQLQTAIFGSLLAMLAFVFSKRRKTTAVLGFLFSVGVLFMWFYLENYNIRRL